VILCCPCCNTRHDIGFYFDPTDRTNIMTSSGKLMNAVRFHGKEDLRFEQVPEPKCGKGQIKIKPAWCGICGRVSIVNQRHVRRESVTDSQADIA